MNTRRRREPFELRIDNLSHEGRGVGRVEGKTTFVAGALPGEQVRARYIRKRGRFDEAMVEKVLEAAPERVQPKCSHADICGGCSLQHLDPEQQIVHKQDVLLELLRHQAGCEPKTILPALRGPLWGYRGKARLGVKHVPKKGGVLVGFRERASPYIADIQRCEVLHPSVGLRLTELRELIAGLSIKDRVPQVEVAIGDDGGALVFRHLAPLNADDQARLAAFGERSGLAVYLQPGGIDSAHALDLRQPAPSYTVEGVRIRFEPTDFTQVNNSVNRSMVARVGEYLDVAPSDNVLDLFCGLGNFTLVLAARAGSITGMEGDPGLVARARRNAADNGIANAQFVAADLNSVEGITAIDGDAYDCVLMDPPRSGAEELLKTVNFGRCRRLVYISCNPATLARDTRHLVYAHGLQLSAAGIMDMFPHTAHVESMAVFDRT